MSEAASGGSPDPRASVAARAVASSHGGVLRNESGWGSGRGHAARAGTSRRERDQAVPQLWTATVYLARLAELAPQYGFGFVHHSPRHVKPQPAQNAAAYLSSYFVKGKRGKETLWESARSTAMPRSVVHVSVKLTQQTGCTMRTLRLKRAIHYVWRADLPLEEVRAVSSILQAFPGAELVAPGSPDRAPPPGA